LLGLPTSCVERSAMKLAIDGLWVIENWRESQAALL
jgi:hypothetical protein